MTPLERAERANQLLADPVMAKAFEDVRLGLVTQAEQTAMDDVTTHHEVVITLQLLKRLRVQLQKYADELAVDQQRKKHDSFIERMRERLA